MKTCRWPVKVIQLNLPVARPVISSQARWTIAFRIGKSPFENLELKQPIMIFHRMIGPPPPAPPIRRHPNHLYAKPKPMIAYVITVIVLLQMAWTRFAHYAHPVSVLINAIDVKNLHAVRNAIIRWVEVIRGSYYRGAVVPVMNRNEEGKWFNDFFFINIWSGNDETDLVGWLSTTPLILRHYRFPHQSHSFSLSDNVNLRIISLTCLKVRI